MTQPPRIVERMRESRQILHCLTGLGYYVQSGTKSPRETVRANVNRNINLRGNPDFYRRDPSKAEI